MTSDHRSPVPWSAGTQPPAHKIPPDAVDCHMHVFDPRLPVDPTARNYPIEATVPQYRLLQRRLGTTRNVVVQPSTYGTDNRGLLNALTAFGRDVARGVAVVDEQVDDDTLRELDRAGVRGLRFNFVRAGSAVRYEMLVPLARRIAPLGWHVQIQAPADLILQQRDTWGRLPCPVVFDHYGGVLQPTGGRHPAYDVLLRLLQGGRTWLKLSAPYLLPGYHDSAHQDTGKLTRDLIAHAPTRLLWATNWPHATEADKPDDAMLLDAFCEACPSPHIVTQILVDNPAALYDFPTLQSNR